MSATDATHRPSAATDAKLVSLLATGAVAVGVLLSGFVLREPAPYELYMAGLIAVWALFGLRISRAVAPLLTLLVAMNVGGLIALTQMKDLSQAPMYLAVSLFLALTAVFYAAVIEARPALYKVIFVTWTIAGTLTATLGILGYFGALPGAELFTRYSRATGGFEDPNVFGPFLALPAIAMLHRVLTGKLSELPLALLALLVLTGGIFLSFSRGAWGLFCVAALLMALALLIQHRRGWVRLRIVGMGIAALVVLATLLIVALQIPAVADLFSTRAQLVQDYDAARLGRFARIGLGFQLAAEHPLGIGPLAFGHIFGEDTHNIWLKALLDYSWLGFASYVLLIVWTLGAGLRILFRDRPWQPYLLCAYVVFIGHVGLGAVIDTDHWRHFYLLLGLVWGGIALEARHARLAATAPAPRAGTVDRPIAAHP